MITDFERRVYAEVKRIPAGQTRTYKQIAVALGKPNAYRAVGNALNKNPFAPKVPCHRVVRSNGKLGGFARGRKKKMRLLRSEGIRKLF